MKIVTRYLAVNFISPFILCTVFFVSFLFTSQLFRLVRIVINKSEELNSVLELFVHIGISFLPMAIPISCLFAAIFTMNKMSEDSEVVAMQSFGISKYQLYKPFLILSLVISALIFALNINLIPHSKTQFKNTIIRLTSKGVLSNIGPGEFFTEIPNIVLFADQVADGGTVMNGVFIKSSGDNTERVIMAKKGVLIKKVSKDSMQPELRLHLSDGNILKSDEKGIDLEKIVFKEYDFPIVTEKSNSGAITKDSMRSGEDLYRIINERERKIAELKKIKKRNYYQNIEYNTLVKVLPRSKIEFWSRINTPFLCIIFVLLGFSLSIKKGRVKNSNTAALGIFFLALYYVLFFTGVSFAKKGAVPAWVVVFSPTLILCAISARYFHKIDWVS